MIRFAYAAAWCVAVVLSAADRAFGESLFRLSGWEYEKPVLYSGSPKKVADPSFLAAMELNKRPYLFFLDGGRLQFAGFANGALRDVRTIAAVERLCVPVIRTDGQRLYALVYAAGAFSLYRLDEKKVELVLTRKHPNNFNADFFLLQKDIILVLAEVTSGIHTAQMISYDKDTGAESGVVPMPPVSADYKGVFFPNIVTADDAYFVAYLVRRYDEKAHQLNDTAVLLKTKDVRTLDSERPLAIVPVGMNDHSPRYFVHDNEHYFILSRKRESYYMLKLLPLDLAIEYDLSTKFRHAVNPVFSARDGRLELFYLSRSGERAEIDHRVIDLSRIHEPGYFSYISTNRRATDESVAIQSFAAVWGAERYLFFLAGGYLFWSGADTSVLLPPIKAVERVHPDRKIAADFSWEPPDDPAGIEGYAYAVSAERDAVPAFMNLSANERFFSSVNGTNGNYYFHLRAIDSLGNASDTVHIPFRIATAASARMTATVLTQMTAPRPLSASITIPRIAEPITNTAAVIRAPETNTRAVRTWAVLKRSGPSAMTEEGYIDAQIADFLALVEKALKKRDYFLARYYLDRMAIIAPERIETHLIGQVIRRAEQDIFFRHDALIAVGVFLFIIMGLGAALWVAGRL
ncbi:MAG: hypothetical protein AABZ39_03650 [Spirochaetota bacterium]